MRTKTKYHYSFDSCRYSLQNESIDNCWFMLETKNPKLVDFNIQDIIDFSESIHGIPYSEYIQMVIEECKENIWFFVREIVRLPINGFRTSTDLYSDSTPFILTPLSLHMFYNYEHGIKCAYIKGRQQGFSTALAIIFIHNLLKNNFLTIPILYLGNTTQTKIFNNKVKTICKIIGNAIPVFNTYYDKDIEIRDNNLPLAYFVNWIQTDKTYNKLILADNFLENQDYLDLLYATKKCNIPDTNIIYAIDESELELNDGVKYEIEYDYPDIITGVRETIFDYPHYYQNQIIYKYSTDK